MGAGRSMSFIGTVGVVAQQGNQAGGVGTGTIATSSSGNYNNACTIRVKYADNNINGAMTPHSGGEFSGGSAVLDGANGFQVDWTEANYSASNSLNFVCGGYIREGSETATNFTWAINNVVHTPINSNDYGSPAYGVNSTNSSTSQDATATSGSDQGIGDYIFINAGGGRGGLTWGRDGDTMEWELDATVNGTDCPTLTIEVEWTA